MWRREDVFREREGRISAGEGVQRLVRDWKQEISSRRGREASGPSSDFSAKRRRWTPRPFRSLSASGVFAPPYHPRSPPYRADRESTGQWLAGGGASSDVE